MIEFLLYFFKPYLVIDNQYVGPVLEKVVAVNRNYSVTSLILRDGTEMILDNQKVFFTKFFAMRRLKKMEKQLALQLAEAEALRQQLEGEVLELEL